MKRYRRILEHILFWSLLWLLRTLASGLYDLDFLTTAANGLSHLPLTIAFTYLFVYRILPLFLNNRVPEFILWAVVSIVATLLLKRLSTQYIQYPLLYGGSNYTWTFFNWYRIASHLVYLLTTVGAFAALKYYRDWRRTGARAARLDAEKRVAELSFLRAQVHPHFLFNTLNSIYYEVLRKSDAAPDLLIRLSGILRFVLYECRDDRIPLAREVKLIRDYVALEQSRWGDRLEVRLEVKGALEKEVPPMICFSLVENAFKHGMAESVDHSEIRIAITAGADSLRMEVENPVAAREVEDVHGAAKGIGLENITRQLELIFEAHYKLDTIRRGDRFFSILEMPLD